MTKQELDVYKDWYDRDIWTKEMVDNWYNKGNFTKEEYEYILYA